MTPPAKREPRTVTHGGCHVVKVGDDYFIVEQHGGARVRLADCAIELFFDPASPELGKSVGVADDGNANWLFPASELPQ